ncbi:MAG: type II secretion system protein GspL [Sphingomonas sp.]
MTLVLFLPTGTASWRWLRIADGAIARRGEGLPDLNGEDAQPPIVIAPADAVTLHWAELPDRSVAQAVAAARLLVADASAAPIAELHVAVGREDGHAERPIGVVSAAQMQAWLVLLAANGVDPAAMVPAPMLLPRPESGYVRADLGGEAVVRGATSGFADEAGLTDLITGSATPLALGRDEIEAAIIAAIAAPALDLRQGPFARRQRRAIDWGLIRRLGWLVAAILAMSLLIGLAQILKYNLAAESIERQADLLARQGLPHGETVNNADRQLDARLAGLRGGGAGFGSTTAAVFAAVKSVPGAEVQAIAFDPNGALRVTASTQNEGQITDLQNRIHGYGFVVQISPVAASAGRFTAVLTVTPR